MTAAVTWAAVSMLAIVAAAGDVRTGRVPNALTFGAAGLGLLFAVFHAGAGGLGTSVLGYVVGLALFLPLFALGGMGAGDVKLLAAFGAWLGPKGALWTAIWASLAGGVLALIVGAWRGYLAEAIRNLSAMVGVWRVAGFSRIPGMTLGESEGPRLAYAVPIGVGAILALWLSVG